MLPSTSGRTHTPLVDRWIPMLTPFIFIMMSHQRRRWRHQSDASSPTRQAATPTSARITSIHFSVRPIWEREQSPPPPPTWKVGAACGHSPIYVDPWGDSAGIGVDHPGLDPQGKHRHPGDQTYGDAMEGRGGHHRYPQPVQHTVSRCPPLVLSRRSHRGVNHGVQDCP